MPKCFNSSLFTFAVFLVYLFILDFIWMLIPELPSLIMVMGTIAILIISFKLAMVTSTKFFQRTGGCS